MKSELNHRCDADKCRRKAISMYVSRCKRHEKRATNPEYASQPVRKIF